MNTNGRHLQFNLSVNDNHNISSQSHIFESINQRNVLLDTIKLKNYKNVCNKKTL